jgi:pyruvate dehydrogenase E2 component (dihydrolipoamide acetyltransferase)
LARKLAGEHGLDLATIRGSGPDGRIVKRDVEAAMGVGTATAARREPDAVDTVPQKSTERKPHAEPRVVDQDVGDEVVRLSQMRRTIARRLSESKFSAPHFYLTIDVDMSAAIAARTDINALAEKFNRERISFNDFVTKACAVALRYHPDVNASYDEKAGVIAYHKQAHVAVAVAVDEGLLTPVIRNADRKGLDEIAAETRALADKARTKRLQPEEYQGSTFTTSNLGMFGIQEFTAIINPPNSCILAIGAIRDEPVVRDGAVVPGKMMKLTLSCDHRVVDGATGARFLDTVRRHLEQPTTMLL